MNFKTSNFSKILPKVAFMRHGYFLGYSCFFKCSVDRVSLFNLFQITPARCTLLLSIFISTSLNVSGNYVPIIRRTYCIYATLVFFTLYGWLYVLLIGMRRRRSLFPTNRPEPYRTKNTSVA